MMFRAVFWVVLPCKMIVDHWVVLPCKMIVDHWVVLPCKMIVDPGLYCRVK
jgi:hypothetical protein